MQIALCDAEKAGHETIKNLLGQYKQAEPDRSLALSSFYAAKELLNHVDEYGGFDLYILDCILPEMNGIELGAALRRREDQGLLIYLSASPDFALDSYRVNALDYLLKPVDKPLFFRSLDKAFAALSRVRREMIPVKTSDSIRLLPAADIWYAERTGKRIYYYMTDGSVIPGVTFNGSFIDAVADLLAHDGMLLVGSSFVVNLAHVTAVTKTDLILAGNRRVPIPRRLYNAVKQEWSAFWLNGGRYRTF